MTEGAYQETLGARAFPAGAAARVIRLAPRFRWRLVQVAADVLTIFAAAMATYGLYLASDLGRRHFDPALYTQLNLAFTAITVFALHGYGAYRTQMGLLRIEAVRRILHAVSAGIVLTLALSFLLKIPGFSRLMVLAVGPAIIVALVVERFALWALRDKVISLRETARPVLVYGAGETGRLLAQRLIDEHQIGLAPAGFLDDDPALHGTDVRVSAGIAGRRVPVLGSKDDLEDAVRSTGAIAVFVAIPSASAERVAEIVARLEAVGIPFFVVPGAGELLFWSLQFGQVAGMPVFSRRRPAASRPYEMTKRLVDVAGAAVVLLLSLPVLAASALLVKMSSPGPVFFSQMRVGYDGEFFTIHKLRTMRQEAPTYARHPSNPRDERVTGVGWWLRRLSIDELPQLWNVLQGEMSLVGPRPEMPFVVAGYDEIQRQRLTVKPGVTGLWQISADRAFRIEDNIQYDLYYVENRSPSLDLAILLMTPLVLLGRNRAM